MDYTEIWIRQYQPGEVCTNSMRCITVVILCMEVCTVIVVCPFENFIKNITPLRKCQYKIKIL
ncbi:hypothetical protein IMSAG025_01150 [Muribaculaceae bacterium]|nr:hypothetical protein IMSAG025_01150 [Muribaculaceae bacterium]